MSEKLVLNSEQEQQKRAIYESLSPRRKRFIDRIGYDKWDPFQEPNDPRKEKTDVTKRTSGQLFKEFISEMNAGEKSNAFKQGVLEMCKGLVNRDDKVKGMYFFAVWYHRLLEKEGHSIDEDEF